MTLTKHIPSIQSLKKTAKKLATTQDIHLTHALDLIANEYGFTHWTLLLKHFNSIELTNIDRLWQSFLPGEMLLLSAPEGAGKLSFALNIAAHAIRDNTNVAYFSMYLSSASILERLHKITDQNDVMNWQQDKKLIINETCSNESQLLKEFNQSTPDTLIIIDYLQAINHNIENESLHNFLKQANLISKQKKIKILILSQVNENGGFDSWDYIPGGTSIAKYFSHTVNIEKERTENQENRNIVLVKSIHYRKQSHTYQFDRGNYRFL